MEWLGLLLIGLGTGTFGIIVGAGGGFILGPLLLVLYKMEPSLVAGTTLTLVWINSVSGSVAYWRLRTIDYRSGVLFALVAIPGAIVGAFTLNLVPGNIFRALFGLLLVGLSTYILLRPARRAHSAPSRRQPLALLMAKRQITTSKGEVYQYQFSEGLAAALNVVLGFISGFFGIGGGFLRTPLLVYAFSFPVQVAVATSIFSLTFIAAVGSITHIGLGHISLPTLIWAGIGLIVGGQLGARLAPRVGGSWILRLLALALIALGVRLLIQGLLG